VPRHYFLVQFCLSHIVCYSRFCKYKYLLRNRKDIKKWPRGSCLCTLVDSLRTLGNSCAVCGNLALHGNLEQCEPVSQCLRTCGYCVSCVRWNHGHLPGRRGATGELRRGNPSSPGLPLYISEAIYISETLQLIEAAVVHGRVQVQVCRAADQVLSSPVTCTWSGKNYYKKFIAECLSVFCL
jgi:hypothetical protein